MIVKDSLKKSVMSLESLENLEIFLKENQDKIDIEHLQLMCDDDLRNGVEEDTDEEISQKKIPSIKMKDLKIIDT